MEESCDLRCWDELIPDALGLIFQNLSLQTVLTVIPSVCKSWGRAVAGPYCWQEVDIEEWSRHREPEIQERMLQMLVGRSGGSLRTLCVSGIREERSFSFIADHAKSLQTLRLPRSEISDSIVEQVAGRLSNVTFLDISYCYKIGASALEVIGRHLTHLRVLRRNMHPVEVVNMVSQDDEASAIAATMPRLRHLEMAYLLITTEGVLGILAGCPQLELLDLRGCWGVELDEKHVKPFPGLKVVGPHVLDCYMNRWDYCSDYSSSSGYLAWDFLAEIYDDMSDTAWGEDDQHSSMEDVDLRFYSGPDFENAGIDWPQSP